MTSPQLMAVEPPPGGLTQLLAVWGRTDLARACARPAGAYANCLAASVACAGWLRGEGVECGLLHLTGILDPVAGSAGRWPFCDPARAQHWTVRAGDLSIDWTARQFRRRAPWPLVEPVGALSDRWRVVDDWACPRCPELFSDMRHFEVAPVRMHREHRAVARTTAGLGPFPDPRHDATPALVRLCTCEPAVAGAQS